MNVPPSHVADLAYLPRLTQEIRETEAALIQLDEKMSQLQRRKRSIEGRAFVIVNEVYRANVEMSYGPDKPWFGNIDSFAKWLRQHSTKQWAEWNERIYRTNDLLANKMPDMPASIDDLID